MGRQVNFFMTPPDEVAVLERLRRHGTFDLWRERAPKPEAMQVRDSSEPTAMSMLFISPTFSKERILFPYVKEVQMYVMDATDSEVVEFSPCEFVNNELRNGRFWFDPLTWDKKKKSPDFIKWADKVLALTKRHCHYGDGLYVGPHALDSFRNGQLSMGVYYDQLVQELQTKW